MTDRLRAAATMAMAALQNHGDACHQVHHAIEELRAALAEPQPDLRQARNDALLEAAARVAEAAEASAAAARGEMDAANSFHRVAIAERNHERTVNARLAVENHELALLVRRLARALRKAQPEHSTVSDDAMEYLRSIGRAGEVMR